MKTIILILVAVANTFVISAQKSYDNLIFPRPQEPIIVVRTKETKNFPVGQKIPETDKLGKNIFNELQLPFHKSVIKLSQCARNFMKDTAGPNVLLLSNEEGGYARKGLILENNGKTTTYPDLNYVDLVVDEAGFEKSAVSIYSHELGHVMMAILFKDFPLGNSVLQHVSMGITDYYMAFSEGWAEHFQYEAASQIQKYNEYFRKKFNYLNSAFLWHSNIDEDLRQFATLSNKYVFDKIQTFENTPDSLSNEQKILAYHTSIIFNTNKVKNAQQMLSCEGFISSLFYHINSDEVLRASYESNEFYNRFLLKPLSQNVKPSDVFNSYENIMLKNFYVWSHLKAKNFDKSDLPIMIQFINEWCAVFPKDKDRIIEIFLKSTVGRTLSNEPARIYEKLSFYGGIGDYMSFVKYRKAYDDEINKWVKDVSSGSVSISKNIGNEIWVENKSFSVRTALWSDQEKKPLKINLNTASVYELATFPLLGFDKARELVRKRELQGFFKSLEDAKQNGFIE